MEMEATLGGVVVDLAIRGVALHRDLQVGEVGAHLMGSAVCEAGLDQRPACASFKQRNLGARKKWLPSRCELDLAAPPALAANGNRDY
jgi:hypothetical protein